MTIFESGKIDISLLSPDLSSITDDLVAIQSNVRPLYPLLFLGSHIPGIGPYLGQVEPLLNLGTGLGRASNQLILAFEPVLRPSSQAASSHISLATGLTGLANRTLFNDRLALAVAHARRTGDGLGLVFLDVDHFKVVNDTLGHPMGDRLLAAIGERLAGLVREGDTVEFTVKVSNQTDKPLRGKVRLTFAEALNNQSVDKLLGNTKPEQDFDIPAKESRSCAWRIHVPDGCGFLTYKAVGAAANVSDGEEGYVPVLSSRILVTESLPLPIRGPGTKQFDFTKMRESGKSDTIRTQVYTVQMTSQPAWYAVMALPYLMEYPYECSEQVFNRLYANALANSSPPLRL